MVYRDNMWRCDNCFSVLVAAPSDIDDVEIEEGITMIDVMKQYEERERER
jgi:predicted neutral ceramidase superfamily lipid hydrolase